MGKIKFTPEKKIEIIEAYKSGKVAYSQLQDVYGMNRNEIYRWILKYEANGIDAFVSGNRTMATLCCLMIFTSCAKTTRNVNNDEQVVSKELSTKDATGKDIPEWVKGSLGEGTLFEKVDIGDGTRQIAVITADNQCEEIADFAEEQGTLMRESAINEMLHLAVMKGRLSADTDERYIRVYDYERDEYSMHQSLSTAALQPASGLQSWTSHLKILQDTYRHIAKTVLYYVPKSEAVFERRCAR